MYGEEHAARAAWWAEHQGRLEELLAAGLTRVQIAAELGTTKNAVCGRVYRTLRIRDRIRARLAVYRWPGAGRCVYPHGSSWRDGWDWCAKPTDSAEAPYCNLHHSLTHLPPRASLDAPSIREADVEGQLAQWSAAA